MSLSTLLSSSIWFILTSFNILPLCLVFLSCMQDSNLDLTIGPYETYEDRLFSYKVFFTVSLPPHVCGISICLSSLSLKSLLPHTVLNFILFGALIKIISLMH